MCYVLTDNSHYMGTDFRGRPRAVSGENNAHFFKTESAAENFLKCLPESLKRYNWSVRDLDDPDVADDMSDMSDMYTVEATEPRRFGNPTKTTILEEDGFDLYSFFENVINVMSQLDRYISNMVDNEQIADMKILDIRHYIRNNDHRLSAIQMQRLGYYLQDLEKERYGYKSGRLIAEIFRNDISALKEKSNIDKMNDILTSKYRPRILDDTDIEYIINKKKDLEFPTDKFAVYGDERELEIG